MTVKFTIYSDTGKRTTHVRTAERVETLADGRQVVHLDRGQCLLIGTCLTTFYGKERKRRGNRVPLRSNLGVIFEAKPEVKP
jgi:hypothetical protein